MQTCDLKKPEVLNTSALLFAELFVSGSGHSMSAMPNAPGVSKGSLGPSPTADIETYLVVNRPPMAVQAEFPPPTSMS